MFSKGVKYLEQPVVDALVGVEKKYGGTDCEKFVNQFSGWLVHHL
jgi:hypothetical protein